MAASATGAAETAGQIHNVQVSVSANKPGDATETDTVTAGLKACGIRGQGDFTDAYHGFTPGRAVVLTGPHETPAAASVELAKAGRCGLTGYSKRATQFAGE